MLKVIWTRGIFLIVVLFLLTISSAAQEKKVAPTSTALFSQIANLDSLLFDAFNNQRMDIFKPMFTNDLEWFQDNEGLLSSETVFKNFGNSFKKEFKLSRKLVPGSLEVYPLKNYGAMEIGLHQFRHIENGKEEVGTFKFLMIWKQENDSWKISRVVSYNH